MKTFAFIFFPQTIEQLRNFSPVMRIVPDFILKSRLKNILPFRISHSKGIRSTQEKEIQGYFMACPLISPVAQELDEKTILEKIISAANIAERLDADILGLDINLPPLTEKELSLDKRLKIAVTRGNIYTAWSIFEAIYRIARFKNIDLKKSVLAIIDAISSIGLLCARKLAEYTSKIILNAKSRDKLELLKERIITFNSERERAIEVIIEEDAQRAVKEADIIINTTSPPDLLLRTIEELKPGAVVCDISHSKNIVNKTNLGRDISVIKGGLIKLPYPANLGVDLGLPKGIVFASIAETMLLAFENKFFSYSLGDEINLDALEEIANIAVKHGFEVWVPEAPVL